ncbi:hypothetical protein OC845_004725 [Tilletia horrida]|nr:hypothetical protein OC845_004725 [Tilletia horrida]
MHTPNPSFVYDLYQSHLRLGAPAYAASETSSDHVKTDAFEPWPDMPLVRTPDELFVVDMHSPSSKKSTRTHLSAEGSTSPVDQRLSTGSSSPLSPQSAQLRSPGAAISARSVFSHPAHAAHNHNTHYYPTPDGAGKNFSDGASEAASIIGGEPAHFRGLSLLDEDDQLATHLDASALDALEDAGEEEGEQLRAQRRKNRRKGTGMDTSNAVDALDSNRQMSPEQVQTLRDEEKSGDAAGEKEGAHRRAREAAAEGKRRAQEALQLTGPRDLTATANHLATSPRSEKSYSISALTPVAPATNLEQGKSRAENQERANTYLSAASGSTQDEDDAAFLAAVNQRLDPAAKLRALEEEFGPSKVSYRRKPAGLDALERKKLALEEDDQDTTKPADQNEAEKEVFIGQAFGVLFRTVLIRGSIILTNHRICFFAMLPPALGTNNPSRAVYAAPSSGDAGGRSGSFPFGNASEMSLDEEETQAPVSPGVPADPAVTNPILIKGPAILHRTGWRRKRRCWFELRADGFCAYPSSEHLYQPLGSIRLQDIEEVVPADFRRVTWLSVKVVGGKTASLEFNTEEACLAWRRELEAALFAYRNSSDKIRISIPLGRIAGVERLSLLHFAMTVTVKVYEYEASSSASKSSGNTESLGKTRDVAFGVTTRNADLIEKLIAESQKAAAWRDEVGFEEAMRCLPSPMIEVEGSRVEEEDHDLDLADGSDKRPRPTVEGRDSYNSSYSSSAGDQMQSSDSQGSLRSESEASSSDAGSSSAKGSATGTPVKSTSKETAAREKHQVRAQRFIDQFALKAQPSDLTLYKADIVRTIPSAGTLAVSTQYLCFWRRRLGSLPDIRLRVPVSDLVGVSTSRAFRWHVYGLSLHIRGHADLPFEFHDLALRDRALEQIQKLIKTSEESRRKREEAESSTSSPNSDSSAGGNGADSNKGGTTNIDTTVPMVASELVTTPSTTGSTSISKKSRHNRELSDMAAEASRMLSQGPDEEVILDSAVINYVPKVINASADAFRKVTPMKVFCLTIGSRGDVQPYISLGKALQAHGHGVTIVSHPEYEKWVRGHGLDYRPVGGDPGKLMQLSVEHRIFSPSFFRESIGKFRDWLDELLRESWEQCQGAELLIESPSTMSGIHVAEALSIPYFRAFTMPWTATSAYPQAFSVPPFEMGPSYNALSYTLFDSIMWRASSGQINRWRKHMLGLKSTDLAQLDTGKVPFIYNFSEAVVPFPNDWGSRIAISGYWFLDTGASEWTPPEDLVAFIEKAKAEQKKIAYIGFGSITISDPAAVTQAIYSAVKSADIRAVVSKGWSARMQKGKAKDEEPTPPECYVVESIPHDWLFPRIDIAVHHGGAGTTGASLRAGLVTLIKPFFGDQYMWAARVQKLGAGIRIGGLDASDFSDALKKAAEDRVMVEKAQEVGRKIRAENGPATAIAFIYQNLHVAKRVRHEREPSKSTRTGINTLMRCNTVPSKDQLVSTGSLDQGVLSGSEAGGLLSEQEEVFSDDGADSGQPSSLTRKRRSIRLGKFPLAGRTTAPNPRSSPAKTPIANGVTSGASTPASTASNEFAILSDAETDIDKGTVSPSKPTGTLSRLQQRASISIPSMPSITMPAMFKDLKVSDSGVKQPLGDVSEAGKPVASGTEGSAAKEKPKDTAKKTPSRDYKSLKAEDHRRAELMAQRIKIEMDRGATFYEAARIQAQQAAEDSATRIRLAEEEAEEAERKEKEEKERKTRTRSSHVLPAFVANTARKSIDISSLWPSAASAMIPSVFSSDTDSKQTPSTPTTVESGAPGTWPEAEHH